MAGPYAGLDVSLALTGICLSMKRVGWSERQRCPQNRMRSLVSFPGLRAPLFGSVWKLGRFRNGCVSDLKDAGLPVCV